MSHDKNINPSELRPFGGCGFIMIAVITFILLSLIISCKTVKQSTSNTESTTEVKRLNLDSLIRARTDSLRKVYDESKKEFEATIDFYNNDLALMQEVIEGLQSDQFISESQRDSLMKELIKTRASQPPAKVIYLPSGAIEATGNIKSANFKLSEWQKRVDSMQLIIEDEVNLRLSAEDSASYYKQQLSTKKVVKTKFSWWLFFFGLGIGVPAGILLRPLLSKLLFAIKTYFNGTKANT